MTVPTGLPAARQLASFMSAATWPSLPPALQEQAKVRLLDALGSVFVGRTYEVTRWAVAAAQGLAFAGGPASFWLAGRRGTVADCAFVNSVLVHSPLIDDTMAWSHPGCNIVPAALVVGDAEGRSGADVLAAIVAAYEIQYRVAPSVVGKALFDRGLRGSAAPGAFGAAAAAAYLMGLSEEGTATALSLAASLCVPGVEEPMTYGTSERSLHMGANTKNGVLAATLARAGFDAGPTSIEGRLGFYHAFTGGVAPAELLDGLGERWAQTEIRFKIYPTAFRNTFAIYSAEQVARSHSFAVDDIESVLVRILPWGLNTGYVYGGPYTMIGQGIGSNKFGVATTLVYGRYDFDTVRRAVGDPRVDAVASRIETIGVEPPGGVFRPDGRIVKLGEVEVTLRDGRTLRADAEQMPDNLVWPDFPGEVEKFRLLTRENLSSAAIEKIIDAVATLDTSPDCSALVELLRDAT